MILYYLGVALEPVWCKAKSEVEMNPLKSHKTNTGHPTPKVTS